MTPKTFAITGTGRCGTRFLSEHMNKSKVWTVLHEPKSPAPQERFRQSCYGEVNSELIHDPEVFLNLEVGKKGIIFRDSTTLLTSIFNRRPVSEQTFYVDKIVGIYSMFDDWLEQHPDWVRIQFEDMVSDRDYLAHVFDVFGIEDLNVKNIDLNAKVNASKSNRFQSMADWPVETRKHFENSKLSQYSRLTE